MTVTETAATTEETAAGGAGAAPREREGDSGAPKPQVCDPGRAAVRPGPPGRDRYSISEVAAYTGLSAHTLRWYERIGLMSYVDRTHTGARRFTEKDLDWLDLVGKLRLTGMSVADMVRYAELVREGNQTLRRRQELLTATREDVRRRIRELQETLAVLDYKIDRYADARRADT